MFHQNYFNVILNKYTIFIKYFIFQNNFLNLLINFHNHKKYINLIIIL
jgi:hypothetical protein